jgi:SAM-dependent MidA family methyltransferase
LCANKRELSRRNIDQLEELATILAWPVIELGNPKIQLLDDSLSRLMKNSPGLFKMAKYSPLERVQSEEVVLPSTRDLSFEL